MNRQQRRAKARRKPDKPKPASRADMVNLAYDVVLLFAMTTLHDKYGFGKTRLADFRRHIQGLMDTVIGKFASVIDLKETLHEETGLWVIEPERYKRRVSR